VCGRPRRLAAGAALCLPKVLVLVVVAGEEGGWMRANHDAVARG